MDLPSLPPNMPGYNRLLNLFEMAGREAENTIVSVLRLPLLLKGGNPIVNLPVATRG